MKLKIFLLILASVSMILYCNKAVKDEPGKIETKEKTSMKEEVHTGWSDSDTYTVMVVSESIETAKAKAKHKILQDIVKVRMLNESRFTDITKINAEFEEPLKRGKVISEKNVNGGVEIYYQITDKDLKQKFEKR